MQTIYHKTAILERFFKAWAKMTVFYNLGIRVYFAGVIIAALFYQKARLWIRGRRGLFKRIEEELQGTGPVVWFHCASLGEFEQGRPVMERWKEHFPDYKIVVTFFSPSGYEIRKDSPAADFVWYLPLDTRANARRFMKLVRPSYGIFVKYEFWHHFLHEAKEQGTNLILISALFRPDQVFFKSVGSWYRDILLCFDTVFVQDENSLSLVSQFKELKVIIAGDTRFDRVAEIAGEAKSIDIAETFTGGRFTFVLGSTWDQDEDLLIRYINEDRSDACFIIAPHEIGKHHIQHIFNRLHHRAALFSMANGKEISRVKVLILDTIGMLSAAYRYGQAAYIGGGFGKGIHNILEPAVYGMPVIFGPKYHNFREAVQLVKEGGAFSVRDYESLKKQLDILRKDKIQLSQSAIATKQFVQRNRGASEIILNYLKNT